MAVELKQLIAAFEQLWPLDGAESWDSPGIVSGDLAQRVSRVLLSVDVTSEIISEAQDGEFDLVFSHHPYLLRGIQTVSESGAKGAVLAKSIRSNIAIYAAHTNADVVESGVSDVLAKTLGLIDAKPLVAGANQNIGHGRVGNLGQPMKLGDFARVVARILPATASGVRVAGDFDQFIERVALCGGAGDSFIADAFASGADVYLTSDLRHHPTQDAVEQSKVNDRAMSLVDVSHWASEWVWLDVAAAQLSQVFPNVQFVVSHIRTDPWEFTVTQ